MTVQLTVMLLLVVATFITAVMSLAGKCHAAVPALLLAVIELIRLLPMGKS